MTCLLRRILASLATLLVAAHAHAFEAGWKSPERYFDERPRQASRVIDAILADPAWKDRIASDSRGPRVGALGHSAGGYTVLALAGARPDLSRTRKHCQAEASEDPIFCGVGRSGSGVATGFRSRCVPEAARRRNHGVLRQGPPLADS